MKVKYLIGVDLGTSSTKAALYRIDGQLVAQASADVPLTYLNPGQVEQDNHDFYRTAALTVRQVLSSSGTSPADVAAIAFDSQMAGVGLIDEAFQPIAHFDSWLDMRCQPYIAQMNSEAGDRVTDLTGCPPTCDHGPKMLWWKHEQPDVYRRTAKFIMPGTYVAGNLAGLKAEQAFIDHTYIHFSGFSDAKRGVWSDELCQRLGLDMGKLPRIVDPCDIVGEVQPGPGEDFGLAPGTLIAAGAGDTAANALGAGIVRAGMLFDVAGTAAVLAGCTDYYVADTRNRALITMRSVIPGLWNPLAYIAGGGIALRWFRDQFFNGTRGGSTASNSDLYAQMIEMAASVPPGSDGLLFSPHLGGRICPASPEMRGAWVGASWSHTEAHFARAILESVAFEYAYYLRILRELLPQIQFMETFVVGGGARSTTWNQIKADVLGVPYQRLAGTEFGTWGAAMIAGKAAGLITDLPAHAERAAVRDGGPLVPSDAARDTYALAIDRYIRLESTLNHFFTET
jgi:xylulokinase